MNQKIKDKWNQIKQNSKNAFNKAVNWVEENPEKAAAIASGIYTIAQVAVKYSAKQKKERKDTCYDFSAGHYWKLRRELTNDEWAMVDRRRKRGEKLVDILDEMRLLK